MTLRAALVGYGSAGRTFHTPLITSTPGVDLTWVVSRNPDRVAADLWECRVGSFDAMLEDADVELVVLATPNDTHADLAIRALEAGKHVVVDKPFALNLAEATSVIEQAERSNRLVTVFHNRRWDGDFLTVRSAIQGGRLGEITAFESRMDRFRPQVQDRWREGSGPGSGLFYDLAPHLVDQALMLFGRPAWVHGLIEARRPGAPTDDYMDVLLGYPGTVVSLRASMLVASAPIQRFAVHGTQGSLLCTGLDVQEDQLKSGMDPTHHRWGLAEEPCRMAVVDAEGRLFESTEPKQRGAYGLFYAAVRDAITSAAPLPVTPAEALAVVELIDLIRVSAREGRRMAVPARDA